MSENPIILFSLNIELKNQDIYRYRKAVGAELAESYLQMKNFVELELVAIVEE